MATINQTKSCDPDCNFSRVALLIGDVWTILILDVLLKNSELRFGDLSDKISGISNSVLSDRLKKLHNHGVVSRVSIASMPPQVIYSLTSKGTSLSPVIKEIHVFGGLC